MTLFFSKLLLASLFFFWQHILTIFIYVLIRLTFSTNTCKVVVYVQCKYSFLFTFSYKKQVTKTWNSNIHSSMQPSWLLDWQMKSKVKYTMNRSVVFIHSIIYVNFKKIQIYVYLNGFNFLYFFANSQWWSKVKGRWHFELIIKKIK